MSIMKITLGVKPELPKPFPKLMITKDNCVIYAIGLIRRAGGNLIEGVVIRSGDEGYMGTEEGRYATDFFEHAFVDFHGTLKIEQ